MFLNTFYRLVPLVVLATMTLNMATARVVADSDTNSWIKTTLLCALDRGMFSNKNCTDAVRVRYSEVEFPDLLCHSLYFFLVVSPHVGCEREDVVLLSNIFCKKKTACPPEAEAEVIAPTKPPAVTESDVETETPTTIKEQLVTPKPVVATVETSGQRDNGAGMDTVACVVKEMLSNKKCKQFLKIRMKKVRNLPSGCEVLEKSEVEAFGCNEDDVELLTKVLCDNATVPCPPQQPTTADPGRAVGDRLSAVVADFSDSCKAAVQLVVGDIVKDKDQACETIEEDLDELCKGVEISKITAAVCGDKETP